MEYTILNIIKTFHMCVCLPTTTIDTYLLIRSTYIIVPTY